MTTDVEKQIQDAFSKLDTEVNTLAAAIREEVEAHGEIGRKNGQALDTLNETVEETMARILDLEQKSGAGTGDIANVVQSVGEQFVNSDSFANFLNGQTSKASFEVQNNTITGSDTTVSPDRREPVVPGAFRSLRIADVMPNIPTSSNAIEYVKENTFTNNAEEQSPGEGGTFPESDVTFTLVNTPVRTIGHFILLSRQMIEDGPAVAGYVNTRLAYGVRLRMDSQLISGDGTGGTLSGILDTGNYTAFTPGTGTTALDNVRRAITDCLQNEYQPTAVILNPAQCEAFDLSKATTNEYLAADPRLMSAPTVWGLPIVESNSMPAGSFALGAFNVATILHTRQGTVVEMSESDDTNFRKHLVTVKATVRGALEVNTPAAIIGGSLV